MSAPSGQPNFPFTSGPVVVYRCLASAGWPYEFVSGSVRHYGYEPKQLLAGGGLAVSLIHPEDRARVHDEVMSQCARGVDAVETEYRVCSADGGAHWVYDYAVLQRDARGRPLRFDGYLFDITERKNAESSLRRERQMFLEGPVVVFLWANDPSWTVEYVSPNVSQFGYQARDLMSGRVAYASMVHPEDLERVAREVTEYSAAGRSTFDQDYRIVEPDGRVHWTNDHTIVIRDEQGRVTHYAGYILDVTDRRQAEEERRRLELQIQHTQKLESLGVLAGGIAHDFNNLLLAVLGHAQLALDDLPPDAPARTSLRHIETAANRAAALAQQMLTYAGRSERRLEAVYLSALVEEMSHLLASILSKKAELRLVASPTLLPIEADATQIRQVIVNLLANASEALQGQPGTIELRTYLMEADRALLRKARLGQSCPPGRYVCLEVRDSGGGMEAATLDRMFEPFFTTKSTGRGLGLAMLHGIVRGHGGAILVDSRPGSGTCFQVLFPASSAAPAETQAPRPRLDAPSDGRGETILVIDDELEVLAVMQRMLERAGYRVLTTHSGVEGLELLHAPNVEIDALVLDMTMPGMSGLEMLCTLRSRGSRLPVLLISGYHEQEAARQAAVAMPDAFLQKPFTPAELTERVRSLFSRI